MFRSFWSRPAHLKASASKRGRSSSLREYRSWTSWLALEPLECRLAPATFTVTTRSDAPFHTGLSLRDAINAANSDPQSLIKFAPGLNGTITLQQGDLDIRTGVKIDANANGNNIAVSGRGQSRVFNISANPSTPSHVTFVGFTTKDGRVTGNGGCIYLDDAASSLVLNDMLVTLCKAVGGSGGGVYNEGLTTLYSSTLENNTADLDGGGAWSGRNLSLYNASLVTDNRARDGGGLYLARTGTTLTIWGDSDVRFNFATRDGGGVYARYNVDVQQSAVHNNTATDDGGGIYSDDGNVSLRDGHVDLNVAINGNGGGIWLDYLLTATDFGDGEGGGESSTINNNYTNHSGGGIFADSGVVRIWDGSQVNENTANGGSSGGGIWAYYDVFLENGAEVNNNSSAGNGGGIYSQAGNVEVDESEVAGNTTLDNGGGIYAYGNVTVDGGTIGTLDNPNSAGVDGGGIYTSNGNFYITEDSFVEGNFAGRNGGGIWGSGHGVVEESTVRGNVGNNNGGGIYMEDFESLWINLSLIEANESGADGGGVHVLNSESFTILDSTFSENRASQKGGGFASNIIENIAVTGSTFAGNQAVSGRGGGIHACNGNLYIVNSTFGGIYEGDTPVLVTPQTAAQQGGAIYVLNELVTINHVTFNDNIAYGGPDAGSAIFSDAGSDVYLHNTLVNDTNEISSIVATDLLSKGNGGDLFSMGHNLVHDFSFINVTNFDDDIGDIVLGQQDLGPLQNNGGPTDTYALINTPGANQAIDNGDDSGPIVDQRGEPRPIDISDIGAFELP